MAQPGPKPITRTRRPLSKEFKANVGKRRPTDRATGRYVGGGEKHLMPVEAIEREAARAEAAHALITGRSAGCEAYIYRPMEG
jgi:hypothetical protein